MRVEEKELRRLGYSEEFIRIMKMVEEFRKRKERRAWLDYFVGFLVYSLMTWIPLITLIALMSR